MSLRAHLCKSGVLLSKSNFFTSSKNVRTSQLTRNYAAARKRFYKKTGILHSNKKYEIILDQRKLKTPQGNLFAVKSEPLALAVATEWDAQKENIMPTSMYLTTLCNTAIDNPNNVQKFDMVQYIMNYIDTDTILFQAKEEEELYKLQVEQWDPIIQWFCDRFQVNIEKSREIAGPRISNETKGIINRYLMSYNQDTVFGFVYGVDTLKSVILTIACIERHITPDKAVLLSRLEEEFQLGHWGRIEWAHNLSQQELQARLAATILFIYCNSSSTFTKTKTSSPL